MKSAFLLLFIATSTFAQDSFYANKDVQRLSPEAFALQPESRSFVSETNTKKEAEAFLSLIQADITLMKNIQNFPALSWEDKEKVLRAVFALEVKALNVKAPELIIDSTTIKGEAYFDFDTKNPGPGKVILNPQAILKDANPYAGLMLLIHETRHSAQIQRAFDPTSAMNEALAKGYRAAFEAQKGLSSKITSFSDFLTLNNEYEAFSFGNFVVGRLTEWKADTLDMGTFASQYNADETLKIDVSDLFKKLDQGLIKDSVLDEFNRLEKVQYDLLTTGS